MLSIKWARAGPDCYVFADVFSLTLAKWASRLRQQSREGEKKNWLLPSCGFCSLYELKMNKLYGIVLGRRWKQCLYFKLKVPGLRPAVTRCWFLFSYYYYLFVWVNYMLPHYGFWTFRGIPRAFSLYVLTLQIYIHYPLPLRF